MSSAPVRKPLLRFESPSRARQMINKPHVFALVGLPARGKTFISKKLCRYLNWIGTKTKVFNVGQYRRQAGPETLEDFFDPNNEAAVLKRTECAQQALNDLCEYLESKRGDVAIFDATNTTKERRREVVDVCTVKHNFRLLFIEIVCDDPTIIDANIQDVKVNSPDYRGMDKEQALADFAKRIGHYRSTYKTINDDEGVSFIKLMDAGRCYHVKDVIVHVQSRVAYFLMNIHLLPRTIYLTRHGECQYNKMGRIGGDSPLSDSGLKYTDALVKYFVKEKVTDLRVWSSQRIRAVQTATELKPLAEFVEYWKALDELDAGVCEGLTYDEIAKRYPQQFESRELDKYRFRYQSGESYEDVVIRLETVIMELERSTNVLVITHQAILRCILAYFLDKSRDELPYLQVPLHCIFKLTPLAYGCKLVPVYFDIEAVDTHRPKKMETMKIKSKAMKI